MDSGILYAVNSSGDADDLFPGDGSCDTDGHGTCTLRAAIEETNVRNSGFDGILIEVLEVDLMQVLPDLETTITISGFGPAQTTVRRFDQTTPYRIFNAAVPSSGTVSFSGMTITGGFVNSALDPHGGGIQNANLGTVNITNCVISLNDGVGGGGGVSNTDFGTVHINNCTISSNSAADYPSGGDGGGILNNTIGTVSIDSSTISGNEAIFSGGGIANHNGGTVTVSNSTVSTNKAETGNGLSNSNGTLTVSNSTISGNTPLYFDVGDTGGIFNDTSGTLNVSNSTISGNLAVTGVQGIGNKGTANVKSNIFSDYNSGVYQSQGYNLVRNADGCTGFTDPTDQTGTTASPLDALLDPNGLQDNGGPTMTIALLPGSPAIDQGTSDGLTGALVTDQRGDGFPRTIDDPAIPNAADGTDIGAFELGRQLSALSAISRKTHGTAGQFDINLPFSGPAGVECRTGGASGVHRLIITFSSAVTVSSVTATPDPNAPGATGSVSDFSVSGAEVTVNLTNVSNAQTILTTLSGVSDGTNTIDVNVPTGVLVGDSTGDGSVDRSDYTLVKSHFQQRVDASNFREDVTVNGSVGRMDGQLVKSKKDTSLP